MVRFAIRLVALFFVVAFLFGSLTFMPLFLPLSPEQRDFSSIEADAQRGGYVARMAGCIACHNGGVFAQGFLAGGKPLKSPFGSFFGPNLTPHEDGLAGWSREDFVRAVATGVGRQGEPLYPALPYRFYARMTDQDLADLWAAFQSVPPAAGERQDHQLHWPFGVRELLRLWRFLAPIQQPFESDPARSEDWNRGAYIVTGPGHCGACHTPRDFLGRPDEAAALAGADLNGEKVPSLDAVALLKEGWSVESLAEGLQLGVMPSGDVFSGSMAHVVRESTRYLTYADRIAIATYLLEP